MAAPEEYNLTDDDLYSALNDARNLRVPKVPDPTLVLISDFEPPAWYPQSTWDMIILRDPLNKPTTPWWTGKFAFVVSLVKAVTGGGHHGEVRSRLEANAAPFVGIVCESLGPKTGLYLAGGSVCRALLKDNERGYRCDMDLFCVGRSKGELEDSIQGMIDRLRAVGPVLIACGGPGVTIFAGKAPRLKIQVILWRYATFAEVLHSFDLGSSEVGFDGENVYGTPLAAFAYRWGLNILDLTVRRGTYEKRICKYFSLGFGLIAEEMAVREIARDPDFPLDLRNARRLERGVVAADQLLPKPRLCKQAARELSEDLSCDYSGDRGIPWFLFRAFERDSIHAVLRTLARWNAAAYALGNMRGLWRSPLEEGPWTEAPPHWGGLEQSANYIWTNHVEYHLKIRRRFPKLCWSRLMSDEELLRAVRSPAGYEYKIEELLETVWGGAKSVALPPTEWLPFRGDEGGINPFPLKVMDDEEWLGKAHRATPSTGRQIKSAGRN